MHNHEVHFERSCLQNVKNSLSSNHLFFLGSYYKVWPRAKCGLQHICSVWWPLIHCVYSQASPLQDANIAFVKENLVSFLTGVTSRVEMAGFHAEGIRVGGGCALGFPYSNESNDVSWLWQTMKPTSLLYICARPTMRKHFSSFTAFFLGLHVLRLPPWFLHTQFERLWSCRILNNLLQLCTFLNGITFSYTFLYVLMRFITL